MTYIGTINLSKEDIKYYNDLLSIDDLGDEDNEEIIKKLGAKQDDEIGIAWVCFENGNSISIDLASGSTNYYDNIVLWNSDNYEICAFDCGYEISEEMAFEYEEDTYIIKCKDMKGEC